MEQQSVSATFYLDSSALVKRYAIETGTEWMQTLCDQPNHVIAVALIGIGCAATTLSIWPAHYVSTAL